MLLTDKNERFNWKWSAELAIHYAVIRSFHKGDLSFDSCCKAISPFVIETIANKSLSIPCHLWMVLLYSQIDSRVWKHIVFELLIQNLNDG